jgi:putative ABC transport system permease protein
MRLWQDLRFAARTLRKSPSFAVTAAVTLSLGIGVTTAIFSICDALLWKPLPLPNIGRLAMIVQQVPADPGDWAPVTPGDFGDLQHQLSDVSGLTAWDDGHANLMNAEGQPESVRQYTVSPNFFGVLGVAPAMGRTFAGDEDQPGREQVVVLSDSLWRRRYAADRGILGKSIRLDGARYQVIGVMPTSFEFPLAADLWTPLSFTPEERTSRDHATLAVMGVLPRGTGLATLDAQLNTLAARLAREYPETNRNRLFRSLTARDFFIGPRRGQYLMLLFGSVLLVFLIACVNVANLQFAHALGRSREVAVRLALGAGRRRLMAQFVTESLLLAVLGAPLGLAAAAFGLQGFLAAGPHGMVVHMAGWSEISLDSRALLFGLAAAAASGVLAGLLPAWQCSRPDLNEALKEGARGSSYGRVRHRLRSILVAAEIAVSAVLLVGAGLMVHSIQNLAGDSRIFEPSTLLTLRLSVSTNQYPEGRQIREYYRRVLERVGAIPGVRTAFAAVSMPYSGHDTARSFEIEGRTGLPGERPTALYQAVSPNYFNAMHVPLLTGRFLGDADRNGSTPVAVIAAHTARRWFPGERTPLGRRLRILNPGGPDQWLTVVGVVADVPHSPTDRAPLDVLYLPLDQQSRRTMNIGIRVASGDPSRLTKTALAAVRSVDPAQLVSEVFTLEDLVRQSTLGLVYVATIMGIFGVFALVLSAVGVYGVMSYLVAQQIPEIGIRMALGAPRITVLTAVLRRGLIPTLGGLTAGMVLALTLARLLARLILAVPATDAVTFATVPLVLLGAALLALYIPARRATAIDPLAALRYE